MKKPVLFLLTCAHALFPLDLEAKPPLHGTYSAFGELLFWNAAEENLDFAIYSTLAGTQPPYAPTTHPISLSDHDHYVPGWRFGIGYSEEWNLSAYWTHFYSKKERSANEAIPGFFFSNLSNPVATASKGNWRVQLDTVDIEASYPVRFSFFEALPHISVRGAWINQQVEALYERVFFIGSAFPEADYYSLNKNDFWGAGLRGGVDGFWRFFSDFALFAKSGVSLLAGKFNVSRHQYLEDTITFNSETFLAGSERALAKCKKETLASSVDLEAGLAWRFCGASVEFSFSLAWECAIWFAQNQMKEAISDLSGAVRHVDLNGDLVFQGLTARAELLF